MIYFSSDYHWNHSKICEYSKRPFLSLDEMNETIINNVNSLVRGEDSLFILGDYIFNKDKLENFKRLYSQINCKNITLLLGNHDDWMEKPQNKDEIIKFLGYFPESYKELKLKGFGYFVLCHYPIYSWNGINRGMKHLFGHEHGSVNNHEFVKGRKMLDVGVDCWYPELGMSRPEYRPFSIEEVNAVMETRIGMGVGHHEIA